MKLFVAFISKPITIAVIVTRNEMTRFVGDSNRLGASGPAGAAKVEPAAGVNSIRFTGYFEVPATGAYRFYTIFGRAGAKAALRVATQPEQSLAFAATQGNLAVGIQRTTSSWTPE